MDAETPGMDLAHKGFALMACPTYAGKQYALEPWLEAFKAQTYPFKYAYQVDNTRVSQAYFELLKSKGIDVTHITPWPDWDRTFRKSWDLILERARQLDCYWVFSVESDNIPAPEALEIMVDLALMGNVHLITHDYPIHKAAADAAGVPENSFYYHELGCTLISTQLLEKTMEEFDEYGHMVSALWGTNERYHGGYMRLTERFKVGHLDGFEMQIPNLGPSTIPGLFYPVDAMPENIGTALPPSLEKELVNEA